MTTEVPQHQWPQFLHEFSEKHDQSLVGVEVISPEIGAQVEGRSLRLRGISADTGKDRLSIFVSLEAANGDHLTHAVAAPAKIWLEEGKKDAEVALEIQSADQTSTLLRFKNGE